MPFARGRRPSLHACLAALAPWLLAATVCFAFRGVCDAFFVQDDFWFLQAVQQPVPNRMWWRGALPDFLRPLTTYWFPFAGWHVFGPLPTGYHVAQLGLFAAAVVAWQRALRDVVGSSLAATAGAAAFGLSWIHLTPLGWFSATSDTVALLCVALALRGSLAYARGSGSLPRALVWSALALIAKEATAVQPVAIFGYLAAQCAVQRRRPTPRELRLVAALLGTVLVYGVGWALLMLRVNQGTSTFALDPGRTVHVLQDSLAAVLPIGRSEPTAAAGWLLVPLLLAVVLPRSRRAHAALALLLWILPAAMLGLTARPVGLQPYYAEFSLHGLALLGALALAELLQRVPARARVVASGAALALLVGYAAVAARADDRAARAARSPSLHQARYAAAAHRTIAAALAAGQFREVVLLDLRDLMWWSIGKGAMLPVLFGVPARIDGYDGCTVVPGTVTRGETLVLRQVGEMELAVVRP